MPVTLVPDAGSKIQNFQIVTAGGIFNSNVFTITQGTFLKGKLEGDNCFFTSYGGATISIRQGQFSTGQENGNIREYVFPKADWENLFVEGTPISVTRYTQVFAGGAWQSTSATVTLNISGTRTYNSQGNMTSFKFVEV